MVTTPNDMKRAAYIFPVVDIGTTSPYPTVTMVTMLHHKPEYFGCIDNEYYNEYFRKNQPKISQMHFFPMMNTQFLNESHMFCIRWR